MEFTKTNNAQKGFTPLEITRLRKKNKENKSLTGFTLLETLISIFIIATAVVGIFSLITQINVTGLVLSSQLTAAYLAQEGLEITRNIRDSNWIKIRTIDPTFPWDQGLTGCALGCEADYNDWVLTPFANQYLKINNGFFNYDLGEATKFKRKITINPDMDNVLQVSVKVFWEIRGEAHQIIVRENLYNWLQ